MNKTITRIEIKKAPVDNFSAEQLKRILTIYQKALELACEEVDNYWNVKEANKNKMTLQEYFVAEAYNELTKKEK